MKKAYSLLLCILITYSAEDSFFDRNFVTLL